MRGYAAGMIMEAIPRLCSLQRIQLLPTSSNHHVLAKFLSVLMGSFRLMNGIAQKYVCLETKAWVSLRMWLQVKMGWKGSVIHLESMTKTFLSAFFTSYVAVQFIPVDKRVDLVFFTAVRAADVLFSVFRGNEKLSLLLPSFLVENGDVSLFTASCAIVMFSWFYVPSALPASYNRWIQRMSELDYRIIEALRAIRCGALQYGQEYGPRHLFSGYAESIGYPPESADAFLVQQIPCEIVHGGGISSCTLHKAHVWKRGFLRSLAIYIPVHALPMLVLHPNNFVSRIPLVVRDVVRSASFLATFIFLQWVPICMLRNVLPLGMADAHAWGPAIGSIICGLSIFLEKKSRRKELGLFVCPRAVYALVHMVFVLGLKRVWTGNQYKYPLISHKVSNGVIRVMSEFMFSTSVGVLVTSYMCRHDSMKRGWLSSVLKWLIEG
jgi:hypothetical protein